MYNVTLTTPVRAAASSEITQLANMVRARDTGWQKRQWQNEVTIIRNWKTTQMTQDQAFIALREADLVIVFRNDTCDMFNPMIRTLRDLEAVDDPTRPVKGDWLLAWQKDEKQKIYKSERYEVQHATPRPGGYYCSVKGDDGQLAIVNLNKAALQNQKSFIHVDGCLKFSFGHCITAHKSQGGEWDRIVVLASDKPVRHTDYWNWLYTAVTRAKKHLTILL